MVNNHFDINRGTIDFLIDNIKSDSMSIFVSCYNEASFVLGSGKNYLNKKIVDGCCYDSFMFQKACYVDYLVRGRFS